MEKGRPAMPGPNSMFPRFTVTPCTCPHCGRPVLRVDRSGPPALADSVDLSAVPEKVEVTPHACPGPASLPPYGAGTEDAGTGVREFSDEWEGPRC